MGTEETVSTPNLSMRAIGDRVIIDPYYDPDKIGSIIVPDNYKNAEPTQGRVVSAGSECNGILTNDYVVFVPYQSEPLPNGLVALKFSDLVCRVTVNVPRPLRNDVIILPDWESKYGKQAGLIIRVHNWIEKDNEGHEYQAGNNEPVLFGHVFDAQRGSQVFIGDRVAIPPRKGLEAGIGSTLYYFIPEDEILAIING